MLPAKLIFRGGSPGDVATTKRTLKFRKLYMNLNLQYHLLVKKCFPHTTVTKINQNLTKISTH